GLEQTVAMQDELPSVHAEQVAREERNDDQYEAHVAIATGKTRDPIRDREAEEHARNRRNERIPDRTPEDRQEARVQRGVVVREDEVTPRESDRGDDAALPQAVRDHDQRRDDEQEQEPHARRKQEEVSRDPIGEPAMLRHR